MAKDKEVAAAAAAENTIPVEAIRWVISVITGQAQFSWRDGFWHVMAVLTYLGGVLFPKDGVTPAAIATLSVPYNDNHLALCLEALAQQGEGQVSAQGFLDKLPIPKELLLQYLFKWLLEWLEKKMNPAT